MNVCSLWFLVAILLVAGAIFHLPPGRPRQVLLSVCNAAFLATWIPNAASAVWLAAFVLSGFAAAVCVRRIGSEYGRRLALAGYVTLITAAFVVLKRYQFLDPLIRGWASLETISIVGLSYMLFRQIHFVVDTAEGQIPHASLWSYLDYQLNVFGLLAGPIQRFQAFDESRQSTRPLLRDGHDRAMAWARLLFGMLKVSVLGAACLLVARRGSDRQLFLRHPADVFRFAALFYFYPAYIYFNFSGYCDIAIAGAALVGIRFPENFNRPYLARNVIDFWARWHITLTHWIRDYIFTPLYKRAVETWPARAAKLSYVCYFAALFLAGVWHGSSWNFVVFGLLHGAGVSANKMWEESIIRKRKRAGLREYMKSPRIRWTSTLLTLHFVCITFLFFPPGLKERADFLRRFVTDRPVDARGD